MNLFSLSDAKALPEPVLFTLQSIAKESEFIPASRELHVGCVRTMAVSQKKVGYSYKYTLITYHDLQQNM